MGIPVRALLLEKGAAYAELGLDDPKWTDDQLLDFMMAYPILINRPIVVTPNGVKLCRPSETALDLLPNPDIGGFVKEDARPSHRGAAIRPSPAPAATGAGSRAGRRAASPVADGALWN